MTAMQVSHWKFQSRADRSDRLLRRIETVVSQLEEVIQDGRRVVAELQRERGGDGAGKPGSGGRRADNGGQNPR